jgi:hypothetical protein
MIGRLRNRNSAASCILLLQWLLAAGIFPVDGQPGVQVIVSLPRGIIPSTCHSFMSEDGSCREAQARLEPPAFEVGCVANLLTMPHRMA